MHDAESRADVDPSRGRYPGIDGMRGLAFLAVFLFHDGVLGIGWAGVPLFFVVSGTLIRGSLERARPGRPIRERMVWFLRTRAARLGPLYVGWLLAAFATSPLRDTVVPDVTIAGLVTGTHNLTRSFAPVDDPWLTHLWSLSAEEQCYLVGATVLLVGGWRAALGAVALAWLSRAALYVVLADHPAYLRADAVYQLTHLDLFLCGMAVAGAPGRVARWRWPLTVAVGAFLFARILADPPATWWSVTALGLPFGRVGFAQPLWSLPVLGLVLTPWVAQAVHAPPAWLTHPVLQHLGRRCYALYVFHWAVLVGLDRVLGVAHPTELPVGLRVAKLMLALGLLVGLAEASWRWLEQPSRRWIRGEVR